MQDSGTAQNRSGILNANSKSLYGFLDPTLQAQAANPQGYGADLPAINTANQQSLGGSTAGITGQANLTAARTRNAGGFQGAIGSGSRDAARQLSQNALGIQEQNAQLKQVQRQQALQSLQQLYGEDTSAALQYLNQSSESLKDENASHPVQGGVNAAAKLIGALTGSTATGVDIARGCWIAAAIYDGWDDPRTIAVLGNGCTLNLPQPHSGALLCRRTCDLANELPSR